uniref:C-type lectin domain-containing protein n=1 Tax=Syphacia muris TaxID=451379 RepID=A0A0N5AS97_9BILA
MEINLKNRITRTQLASLGLLCFSVLLMFISTLTPAWQVANDLDANQFIQSGLWIYCPGSAQCWYIFNDDSVNFYEKTKVCRFFLLGDCRKKLVRTPYFFSWHKAVFAIMLIAIFFGSMSAVVLGIILLLSIGLAVFVTNAEMLESKYYIGVKQTFRKEYGYSFYLSATAILFLLFSLLGGVTLVTYVFLAREKLEHSALPGVEEDELEWKRRNFIERMQVSLDLILITTILVCFYIKV